MHSRGRGRAATKGCPTSRMLRRARQSKRYRAMVPSPEPVELPPEVRLLARLRMQRLVFGAFAAILVTAAALGLAAYRRMQFGVVLSERQADGLRAELAQSERQAQELEQRRTQLRQESDDLSRALGLACARLAVAEVRNGSRQRAQALLQDAMRYGPPLWWPLAAGLAREPAVHFETGPNRDAPVACGHATAGGERIAVARNAPGACVVEVYDGNSGALVASGSPALPADRAAPLAEGLQLRQDGQAVILAAAGRLFLGRIEGNLIHFSDLPAMEGRAVQLCAAPDFKMLLVSRGGGGLLRLDQSAQGWNALEMPVPGATVLGACFASPGLIWVVSDKTVLRRTEDGTFVPVCDLSISADSARIGPAGGGMAVVARNGTEIEYFVVELPSGTVRHRLRREFAGRPDGSLILLADGVALSGMGGGRTLELRPGEPAERTLGGYGPTFAAWHGQGLVFGNARGDIGLRVFEGPGRCLAVLPTQLTAQAQAFGFVTSGPEGDRCALLPGQGVLALTGASRVQITGSELALTRGDSTSWGSRAPMAGTLLGGGEGGVLLWRGAGRLIVVRQNGPGTELRCVVDSAPDDVAVAADMSAALFRWQDALYRSDLRGDPQRLGGHAESSPDLMAISTDGSTSAVSTGTTVTVRTSDGTERSLMTATAPQALALLFRGSVLASAESGSLALYEVDGGRELARFAGVVSSMAATPADALLLVCPGSLRILEFPRH